MFFLILKKFQNPKHTKDSLINKYASRIIQKLDSKAF